MRKFIGNEKYNPYVIAFIVSLFFSFLGISTDNLINHDGIYFMSAAKIYLHDGPAATFKIFPWPFYSWFVAIAHQVLWFSSIEQTAHFVNALLIAATCILFIRVYAEITTSNGSLWVAAVLVLTLGGINKYRADIMKDFGYWCFYLAGFYCLLRYYSKPKWLAAIGWQFFMGLAFLFRIEGLAIIALGPLAIFLKGVSFKERLRQAVPLYSVYIVGLIVLVVAMVFVDASGGHIQLGRLSSISYYLNIDGWINAYNNAISALGEIHKYEGEHSRYHYVLSIIYVSSLFIYVLIKIVECIGLPYFVVFLFGASKKYISINENNKVVIYFIVFLFVFFLVYELSGQVITPRYTTTLVLMLLLLFGQVVERLIPVVFNSKNKKVIVAVIAGYLFISTLDSVISTQGDSKTHIIQAGYWIRDNADRSVPVYSNSYKSLYYTDRGYTIDEGTEFEKLVSDIKNGSLGKDAYLIIKIEQEENQAFSQELDKLIAGGKIKYVASFSNDDHDRSVIYRLVSSGP